MNGRVLLVIKSLTLRMHAAEALSSAGLRVLVATNREEALAALGTDEFPSLLVVTEDELGAEGLVGMLRRKRVSLPVLVLAGAGDVSDEAMPETPVDVVSPDDVESLLGSRARAMLEREPSSPSARERPYRVLAVDDSETFLQRVVASLHDAGYEVSTARSGEEALEVIAAQFGKGQPPDAVLLDMVMPGISGDETCRRIKANAQWRAVPVLVHTGRDDSRAILDALNAGADDFVAKSADDTILRARLRAQLRRKASEDESRRIRERLLANELEITRARAERELSRTRERLLADLARKNEELVQEKERAEGILESITDAFLSVGLDWRLEYLNREAERLLGRDRESALGRSLWTELPQLAGAGFEHRLRAAMKQRSEVEFEEEVPALDAWFEVRVFPATDGLSVYFRDVSARRRTTENRLLLLAASANLARSLDFDRTLDTVARQLLGPFADMCVVHLENREYGRRTVIAHVEPDKEDWAQEMATRAPSPLNTPRGVGLVMRTQQPDAVELDDDMLRQVVPVQPEESMLRKLGMKRLLAVPLLSRGKAFGALVFGAGQHRHPYDDEDVAFGLEMAGRASLALENARLYRESQEAVRLRDEFLAIASHELRTPLTALRLLLQSQLRQLQRLGSNEVPASSLVPRLERADSQSLRLGKLVENLLDITRLTANRLVLEYGQADLAGIVRDVTERYEGDMRQAGCSLELRAERPVLGRWDAARLDQVVTNLLTNAIKYGREGTITVSVSGDAERARLTVKDEGIGIAAEDQERIFERFARGESEQHYGGFGLGLWIARHLVEAHGGSICVESRRGSGATFHVELPRQPPGASRPALPPAEAHP